MSTSRLETLTPCVRDGVFPSSLLRTLSSALFSGSRIRVTSDVIFPGNYGQLIVADIGEAPFRAQSVFSKSPSKFSSVRSRPSRLSHLSTESQSPSPPRLSNSELKATLRRLSKLVLAGYGGASLLFFGVPLSSTSPPPPTSSAQAKSEETQLANAINASEAEAAGNGNTPSGAAMNPPAAYSWWDVLLGKHDHDIVQNFATNSHTIGRGKEKSTAPNVQGKKVDVKIGAEHLMPRFWVLTDHGRAQVVLVLRGLLLLQHPQICLLIAAIIRYHVFE